MSTRRNVLHKRRRLEAAPLLLLLLLLAMSTVWAEERGGSGCSSSGSSAPVTSCARATNESEWISPLGEIHWISPLIQIYNNQTNNCVPQLISPLSQACCLWLVIFRGKRRILRGKWERGNLYRSPFADLSCRLREIFHSHLVCSALCRSLTLYSRSCLRCNPPVL